MQGPWTAQTVGLKISHPDSNEFIVGTALHNSSVQLCRQRSQQLYGQDERFTREQGTTGQGGHRGYGRIHPA